MSFSSKVLYTGDGVLRSFNVPMPYISQSHVNVYLDLALQLETMHYVWTGPSTIQFVTAPADDSAIEIKRNTSPINPLVDFVNGSVLNESDLDTAYLHNFYLQQEFADSFNEVINSAVIEVATAEGILELVDTDLIIQQLVITMLEAESAATLQARIADIDLNAEAIVTLSEGLQVQINTLAQGIAATVYVQAGEPIPGVAGVPDPIPEGARWYDTDDNNAPYIYQASAWVSITDPRIGVAAAEIDILQVDVVDNAAAIVDEAFVRATDDTAFASELALIGAQNVGKTAFVIDLTTAFVGPTESLATRFTSLSAADSTNAADIVTEQNARVSGDNAVASTVTTLAARVTTTEGDIVTNASAISSEATTRANADSASAILISQLEAASTATDINVAANAASIVAEAIVASNATSAVASDVSALDARITSNTGDITANAGLITNNTASVGINAGNISANTSSITSLSSEVDLRNRTFRQALPPTAFAIGDLWIDSDDNILYRWNGTAWTNAQDLAIAGNASAVNAVDARVDITDGNVTTNANDITSLTATVGTNTGNIATVTADVAINAGAITTANGNISVNASDITTLAGRVTSTEGSIVTANANIALNVTAISTADGNILANAALITGLQNSLITTNGNVSANTAGVAALVVDLSVTDGLVTANAFDITQLQADLVLTDGNVSASSSAISVLQTTTSTHTTDIGTNAGNIAANVLDIGTANGNIAANALNISTNASSITGVSSRVTIAEGTIVTHTGDISTLEGVDTAQGILISGNATAISGLTTDVSVANGLITTNAGAITTVSSRVTTAEGDIAAAEITIGGHTTAISTLDGEVLTLEAKYGVTLNVNGYVTGFAQNNDGTTGEFVILADKFAIVDPIGGPLETQFVPFAVSGGVVSIQNLEVSGSLLVNGSVVGSALVAGTIGSTQIGPNAITSTQINANAVTATAILAGSVTATKINVTDLSAITADLGTITAGTITIDSAGYIRGGQTTYNTGTGFFLGYDTSAYKFSIGDGGTANFITWDGTEMIIRGNISIGNYTASTSQVLLAADTERSTAQLFSYVEVKKFAVNKPGTVRVYFDMRVTSTSGGIVSASDFRIKLNGVVQATTFANSTTWLPYSTEVTTTEASTNLTVEYRSGERNSVEPVACGAHIRNCQVRAIIELGESVITD